ncbi:MAG: 4-alpha-glucanotransferase [Candidatus Tectomicrobia bacterium]|uniref:4-alpha-glucanotransferase n=1 Tax=Tectimicrobiota bacterium TaxID=2528274 RepID=A0A938B288_UNCTE|nr:4-alpha-glucanotransferase [Candidatus Tectomicrobia bacterium]
MLAVTSQRASGLLLHPTSLPGRYGIGDLGEAAYQFVDFLGASGQQYWQVLPLGPPDDVYSPYQGASSMAGNIFLLSLTRLVEEGWLPASVLHDAPRFPEQAVDYATLLPWKGNLLRQMAQRCVPALTGTDRLAFEAFCAEKQPWLDAFATFIACKEAQAGRVWTAWPAAVVPEPSLVAAHKFLQWQFFRQWQALKQYCHAAGIRLIGDMPIYVAHDSADVWGHPALFALDEGGQPTGVAGVPPDYFSATGQRWGNPVYRWDVLADTGYQWWLDRIRAALELVDVLRLDHFRGFESYYVIPPTARTAVQGVWQDGPGDSLFVTLQQALGELPFIAEDLGLITPEVIALRERWGFPSMRVLQFGFDDETPENPHTPYNYTPHCVVYTGTHDNDTAVGWFSSLDTATRTRVLRYLPSDGQAVHWDMIRVALASVARTAIVPLQDVLGLDTSARMNLPGTRQHNWRWRLSPAQLDAHLSEPLRLLTHTYGRLCL